MTMKPADIATVTPELEAACRKLIEGVQMGGPYLPLAYNRLRVQFPGNHGGVNWGGTSFNPQLGYLFVNTNELGQLSGLKRSRLRTRRAGAGGGPGNRVDPDGPYEGVPGGGRFRIGRLEHAVPAAALGTADGRQREHRRVRVARAARRHRQPAAGQAEDRPSGQRRHHRHRRRAGLRRRDRRRRFRAFDAKTGKELWTFKLGGAAEATPMTYLGPGRPAVRRHHVDRRRLLR